MPAPSRWLHAMMAWLLPPIVGTAVGGGMIVMLKEENGQGFFDRPQFASPQSDSAKRAPSPQAMELRMPKIETAEDLQNSAIPKKAPQLPKPDVVEKSPPPKPEPEPVRFRVSDRVRRLQAWDWQPFRENSSELAPLKGPGTPAVPLVYQAVVNQDPAWIQMLVRMGADANATTAEGDTPLCAAVRLGSVECVHALLTQGAETKKPGLEKQPPIALAALRRNTTVLAELLNGGADPNTRFPTPVSKAFLSLVTIKDLKNALESDRGVTPLIACSARGDVESAAMLLKAGARQDYCTTRYHRYPINFAATQGYLFLMRILLGRQPESEPVTLVTVDLTRQRAWVTKEGRVVDSCSVSTGREGYATPAGRYVITDKHSSWTSTLYHVSMPYFMRLNCSAIGLHSGYVTGRPASHGCIRLPYEKAQKFFKLCQVGDEVQIVY